MKAWEIRVGDLVLHEVKPASPREGETVIRVSHIGICGSDLPKLLHPKQFALPEPWRPGHEIVGNDPTGQTVTVDPLVPCDTCPRCVAGNTHLCPHLRRLGWDLPGGFAEEVVIPAGNVHPVPDGIDPLHATLVDPAAVAVHGLRCNPVGSPGQLAIIGAGTVGLLTALYAHQQGWTVTVLHRDGRIPPKPIADAIPATFQSPVDLAMNETFDVVVDAATGADSTPLHLALRLVSDGGSVVVQNAYLPHVHLPTTLRDLFRRSICLIGSFSHCRRSPDDFTLALDLLRSHRLQVANLAAEAGRIEGLPTVLKESSTHSVRQVLTTQTSRSL
jgi:threonine dehydrogenase-like Zn-dependent dehydrogenase